MNRKYSIGYKRFTFLATFNEKSGKYLKVLRFMSFGNYVGNVCDFDRSEIVFN
jgi:hypothetical protein